MTSVLLDTHALYWWASEPHMLGPDALRALSSADDPAVAAITWWELAWLMRRGRVKAARPMQAIIASLAGDVRTIALTPAIATRAAELPDPFPRDPMDRLIYATAVEHGLRLVTKDGRLHAFDREGAVVVW